MSALTLTFTGWGSKLSDLVSAVKPRQKRLVRPGTLDAYFASEFRAYGLGLVRAQASQDHAKGIVNQQRVEAAKVYLAALEDVVTAYELPDDGGMYGGFSANFPEGSYTRAEWIEMAEVEADAALLQYCAA